MDQRHLDDVEKKRENEQRSSEGFGTPDTEKTNDVTGIVDKPVENKPVENNFGETKSNPAPEPKKDDAWNFDEEDESKPGSTWKIISGILLILLVAAIYTNGFNFTGAATTPTTDATELTQAAAEKTVLDYINNNLLQAPFTATIKSTKDLKTLYQVTVNVAGQTVDSYITKDGKLFFPQGFNTTKPLDKNKDTTTTAKPAKVEVSVDDDPMKGKKDAPVTIIEFSEYQCPFCKRFVDSAYPQISKEYVDTGKVRYIFRDFPLGFHAKAKSAAMAAQCAYEQGKYWEYHDLLFKNQATLGKENYKKWAKELGLDTTKFDSCVDTEKYKAEVEKDLADGKKAGVSGTPAFFINGKMISGAQPYAVFKKEIDDALKAASTKTGTTTTGTTETKTGTTETKTGTTETKTGTTETKTGTTETAGTTTGTTSPTIKEVKILAKKWRFDPNIVTVNKGDTVKLSVSSTDVDFKFVLAGFNISQEVKKGATSTFTVKADKVGTFAFECGTYCDQYGSVQGGSLKGNLVVK